MNPRASFGLLSAASFGESTPSLLVRGSRCEGGFNKLKKMLDRDNKKY